MRTIVRQSVPVFCISNPLMERATEAHKGGGPADGLGTPQCGVYMEVMGVGSPQGEGVRLKAGVYWQSRGRRAGEPGPEAGSTLLPVARGVAYATS